MWVLRYGRRVHTLAPKTIITPISGMLQEFSEFGGAVQAQMTVRESHISAISSCKLRDYSQ